MPIETYAAAPRNVASLVEFIVATNGKRNLPSLIQPYSPST
jgi:hypothetical protein